MCLIDCIPAYKPMFPFRRLEACESPGTCKCKLKLVGSCYARMRKIYSARQYFITPTSSLPVVSDESDSVSVQKTEKEHHSSLQNSHSLRQLNWSKPAPKLSPHPPSYYWPPNQSFAFVSSASLFASSLKSLRRILPDGLFGMASTKVTPPRRRL